MALRNLAKLDRRDGDNVGELCCGDGDAVRGFGRQADAGVNGDDSCREDQSWRGRQQRAGGARQARLGTGSCEEYLLAPLRRAFGALGAASPAVGLVAGFRELEACGWLFLRHVAVVEVFATDDPRGRELRLEAGKSDRTANKLPLVSFDPGRQ